MGSCESDHMSDIALQLANASASTPYRGSYISLRNGEGVLVNRVGCNAKVEAERFPSPVPMYLWRTSRADLESIWTMLQRETPQKHMLPEITMSPCSPSRSQFLQRSVVGLGLCTTR